jgi:hypothetical protein
VEDHGVEDDPRPEPEYDTMYVVCCYSFSFPLFFVWLALLSCTQDPSVGAPMHQHSTRTSSERRLR